MRLPLASIVLALARQVEDGEGRVRLDDDDDLDLGLRWEAIEDLRAGEEIVIDDGESRVAIWLE